MLPVSEVYDSLSRSQLGEEVGRRPERSEGFAGRHGDGGEWGVRHAPDRRQKDEEISA